MKYRIALVAMLLFAAEAKADAIDLFYSTTLTAPLGPCPTPAPGPFTGIQPFTVARADTTPHAIGGYRKLHLFTKAKFPATQGTRDCIDTSVITSFGVLSYASGSGLANHGGAVVPTDGRLLVTWDGTDNLNQVTYNGLGGIDVTNGGLNNGVRIRYHQGDIQGCSFNPAPYTTLLKFYDANDLTGSNPCIGSFQVTCGQGSVTFTDIEVRFSDFVRQGSNNACTFTNIGAIQLEYTPSRIATDAIWGALEIINLDSEYRLPHLVK